MAQISLEELYTGERAGKPYGIANKVFVDLFLNGIPDMVDEGEWIQMLYIKHTLIAAEQMRKKGDFVTGITDTEPSSSSAEVVNANT